MEAKKFSVHIKGIAPLLMHGLNAKMLDNSTIKSSTTDYSEEWKKTAYHNGDNFFIPAVNVEASIRDAGKQQKVKKVYLTKAVKSSLFIDEDDIPLLINGEVAKDWEEAEVDIRPVTVQRARILRSRAKFPVWELKFTLQSYHSVLDENVIRELITKAGMQEGVGDFRPRFGRFTLVSLESIE